MDNFIDLLKDNIVIKSDLVIKRHKYLGLDATQASFLAKIFVSNEASYSNLNAQQVAELMDVDIDTAKLIIERLIVDGFIAISNNGATNEPTFNFDLIIEKLMMSYSSPLEEDSIEKKIEWVNNKISFELTDENKIEIEKLINNTEWNSFATAVVKFIDQNEQTFPLLVSLIKTVSTNKNSNSSIKAILEHNWLVE